MVIPTARGGSAPSSTRSTPARSSTPTATESGTSRASAAACPIWPAWAWTPSGSAHSTPHPWPTSATTCPTTATWTRSSGPSTTPSCCSPRPTSTACGSSSTSSPTTARPSTPGSPTPASPGRRATATGTSGGIRSGRWPRGGPRTAAEQLDGDLHRRAGLDVGAVDLPVVPAPVPARATGPQLAQPRPRGGHARRVAVLARPRRGRVPCRRGPLHRQGPGPARRSPGDGRYPPLGAQQRPPEPPHPAEHAPLRRRLRPRPRPRRRGFPAVDGEGGRPTTGTGTSSSSPSTSPRCSRRGRPTPGAPGSTAPSRCSTRSTRGRRGSSRTTTTRATAPATARTRALAPPRSCSSACGAARSSSPVRSSGWPTPSSLPSASSTPGGGTAAGRRFRGTPPPTHGWAGEEPWLPWPPDSADRNAAGRGGRRRLVPLALPAGAGRPE